MRAWHFVGSTLRDGAPIPADGELLRFSGEPILCQQGFHASLTPFDALQYAPRSTLCLVEVGGTILRGDDKVAATERTIVCRMDATEMLLCYARMQALSVIHHYPNGTDDAVFDYLMTGDESLRTAARAAAEDAARAAARAGAWAAAEDAAAAAAAAWAGAEDAAEDAAAARAEFNALVYKCFGVEA